jgi:hypothetical protein
MLSVNEVVTPGVAAAILFHPLSIDIHKVSRMRAVVAGYKAALSNTPTINRAKPLSVDIHNVSRIRAPWLSTRLCFS